MSSADRRPASADIPSRRSLKAAAVAAATGLLTIRRVIRACAALKTSAADADSECDSRLGTDGNQPCLELREGAADDAALLISPVRGPISRQDPPDFESWLGISISGWEDLVTLCHLELATRRERSEVPPSPRSPSPAGPSGGGTALHPSIHLTQAAAASSPVVSDSQRRRFPNDGRHPTALDRSPGRR